MSDIIHNHRGTAAAGAYAVLLAACWAYGAFALASGFGLVGQEITRAFPAAFFVHALSGGVALMSGGIQASSRLRHSFPALHRVTGRAYVVAVSLAGTSGVANAIAFDAPAAAKVSLCLLCILWLFTTGSGYIAMHKGGVANHAAWMVRSLSLSVFFVTFSFWVPAFASTRLPHDIGYTLAVTLSWTLNLIIAEAVLRAMRSGKSPARLSGRMSL